MGAMGKIRDALLNESENIQTGISNLRYVFDHEVNQQESYPDAENEKLAEVDKGIDQLGTRFSEFIDLIQELR